MAFQHFPDWRSEVTFSQEKVMPHQLYLDDQFKVLLAALEPGQTIPEHPEGRSAYYFLEGSGMMRVDGQEIAVQAGSIVVMPGGTARGLQAQTRLVFFAARVAEG